ncbi:MAG: copper homeostasis protein CutC [Candidatus Promineifilaceae bacterium]
MIEVEICLNGIDSAIAAQAGGATRVELCDNLMEGGTTPSQGMVAVVADQLDIGVMAMIRPRGGDFLYTDMEFAVMAQNVKMMHQHGIQGVVFGMLLPDGQIDKKRMQRLIELARPMEVTCHRAFDMSRDPFEALDTLLELGVDRLLTSGQELNALRGLDLLTKLQQRAGDDLIIMPAVEVTVENARQIVETAKVREIHIGSNVERQRQTGMCYQNPRVSMGDDFELPEYSMPYTSAELVQEIVEQVRFK